VSKELRLKIASRQKVVGGWIFMDSSKQSKIVFSSTLKILPELLFFLTFQKIEQQFLSFLEQNVFTMITYPMEYCNLYS
jgi:hypothetical protein